MSKILAGAQKHASEGDMRVAAFDFNAASSVQRLGRTAYPGSWPAVGPPKREGLPAPGHQAIFFSEREQMVAS
ncbi:unnamed protein product [Arctogadus glacialis]